MAASPGTSLLSTGATKLSLDPSLDNTAADHYTHPSFRGSAHYLHSKHASSTSFHNLSRQQVRAGKLTMQSVKYEQDEFQLIPYFPFASKYEKYVESHLPILYWLPRYQWSKFFVYDLMAALTAMVMVIPQSMGYALIAGLPPIHGLYSAIFGHSLYAIFGTSGQLIIAPVAIVSLMTEETLHRLPGIGDMDMHNMQPAEAKAAEIVYVAYASCVAFQVGVIALFLGVVNAGVFANMLAEPVICGFTFGAAILIGMSQLKFLFQIEIEGEELVVNFVSLFANVSHIHVNSLILSVCCIVLLLLHKYGQRVARLAWFKFVPIALILVIIVTAISSTLDQDAVGWDIIGDDVFNGLPKFRNFFLYIEMDVFWGLWTNSLLITIIAYIETIAVATKFAEKHDYSINASQELIALGVANLIGCWFQTYAVAGVLSLAAVVESAGALTPLYTAMAGVGIIVVTSFFITLFEYLPKPVLGAIVCVGILNLIDLAMMRKIWRHSKKDFMVLCCTVAMTLLIGIDYGVLVGVIGSLLMFIYQSTVHIEHGRLGKVADSEQYEFVSVVKEVQTRRDMLILRWDEVLFFGNSQFFKDRIKRQIVVFLAERQQAGEGAHEDWCLLLCFESINHIDFTAMDALHSLLKEIRHKQEECTLLLANVHHSMLQLLDKAQLIDAIGGSHRVFASIHLAELWWDKQQQQQHRSHGKTKSKQQTPHDQNAVSMQILQQSATTKSLPIFSLHTDHDDDYRD